MLMVLEKFSALISDASSESDLIDVLNGICAEFGFGDAYIIEYESTSDHTLSVLDTRTDRLQWWQENVVAPRRQISPEIYALLSRGDVVRFDGSETMNPAHELLAPMLRLGLMQAVMVPIKHDQKLIGVVGYTGWPDISREWETALQLLTYNLLAQKRALRSQARYGMASGLTPREREVINLAAEGKTSSEIAELLGMSARTANQQVENVGAKLGTRNRAHTVAEAIRQRMLT